MRHILDELGWSGRYLAARRLGVQKTTVQRLMAGEATIKPGLAAWLENMLALVDAHPAPEDWDVVIEPTRENA